MSLSLSLCIEVDVEIFTASGGDELQKMKSEAHGGSSWYLDRVRDIWIEIVTFGGVTQELGRVYSLCTYTVGDV